ncbi:lectin like domain-containing protein [Methanobrevibacter sp. UBA212]|uniref:lectin like domain-containing protein n=1 Tax=Methanobrevibacter sp. UBA212 TaxID=1915476 RepID=UPI0025E9215D|nr:lectin like domain-containing protein [Methanobrevibacter sp. UBA212]
MLIVIALIGLLTISAIAASDLNTDNEDLSLTDGNVINVSNGDGIIGDFDDDDDWDDDDDDDDGPDDNQDDGQDDIEEWGNVIYFNSMVLTDGDGSKENPYNYLNSDRIKFNCTAYLADGEYNLEDLCLVDGVKLIGQSRLSTIINCDVSNQYDFIIDDDSFLSLINLTLKNANILNHGTLNADNVKFQGNDIFGTDFGGVIFCDSPMDSRTTLVLNKCVFEDNQDYNGGVIAAMNSDIDISGCDFQIFHSDYKGGAIYCLNSKLDISKSTFAPIPNTWNTLQQLKHGYGYASYYGGSIYCENSKCWFSECTFKESKSYSFGGSIALLKSNATIEGCSFSYSSSLTDGGGAIYNSNGNLKIEESSFTHGSSEFGGAICNLNSVLTLDFSEFNNNSATYGGALYDMYGSLNIFENTFTYSYASIGGTIYTRIPNSFNFMDNTVSFSFAQEGSRIFFDGKSQNIFSSVFMNVFDDYFEEYSQGLMIPLDSSGLGMSNIYYDTYKVIAEFKAILNGREYSLKSNDLNYCTAINNAYVFKDTFSSYTPYLVSDDGVSLMIYDPSNLNKSYINTGYVAHNISASVRFNSNFTNPFLHFYLYDGDNKVIQEYSVDLSNKSGNGDQGFIENCTVDFGNAFLTTKYDNLYEASSFSSVSLVDYTFSSFDALPFYYNSDDYGLVSSVKNQGEGGNCWAFAGLATLETCLKKATGISFDFSEENAKNLMSAYSVFGLKLETNAGGYESMLMSYLTSWLGPLDESAEDYDDYSSISIQGNPMFHIQNIKFLPARLDSSDNALYKLAIRDNGAVSVTFKWGAEYHAVSLVGWDDNYKGKDSLGNDANGAWIFKNSWGPDWGNNGFGYLSYEQKISEQISPNMYAYTFIFNNINPYTKIYQYDYAGVSEFYHYDSIYFKNKFIATNDSLLSAFASYFDSETNFTVMVYVNDQLVHSQSGMAFAGYNTMPFNDFIQLNEGDEFTIALNNHNQGDNCIPVCSADEITKKTFNSNVSFISIDGENWFDLYDYADSCHVACIKAFTQEVDLKSIRINMDEFNLVNTKNFNIKIRFDDFVGIESIDYCLVKVTVDGKSYYAQIKDGMAHLNLYLADGNHSLSAQYRDNVFESNVVQFNFTVDSNHDTQSFNSLQDIINNAADKSSINLNKDYFYDGQFDNGEYGVQINKSITVNGNGHVIDGLSEATGFYISANNVVLNNIVFNNTVSRNGGAVYIAGRNVTLNNCIFINSRAAQNGGGIYSLFDVTLNNCRFVNNTANVGGGLYLISAATSNIQNSYFDNNFAYGGCAVYVGGIGHCFVSYTNFTNNAAEYNGGAVLSSVYYSNFTDCLFVNNSASYGGAVFSNSYSIGFEGCKFLRNLARDYGGAIMAYNIINIFDSEFVNNSNLEAGYSLYGGAVYSIDNLKIYNSRFTGNHAEYGGAIYNAKAVLDSNFTDNSAKHSGGAIYNGNYAKNCIFNNNSVEMHPPSIYTAVYLYGGAVDAVNSVENCIFINNSIECHPASNSTAVYSYGGAIYNAKVVKDSIFINNSVSYDGGAISKVKVIRDSKFINNLASYGGGAIFVDVIVNSTFINNSAVYSGGAVYDGKIIRDSMFIDNFAEWGGAIYKVGVIGDSKFINNSAYSGGAAYITEGYTNITNSSFANNSALYGGVIASNNANIVVNMSSCNFTNNKAVWSGGAIYSGQNGSYFIESSSFINNSATYGGAIYSIVQLGEPLSVLDIHSSTFSDNVALFSGGAISSDGKCIIEASSFTNNCAEYGNTLYARAYLDLRNSKIRSDTNVSQIYFCYHYGDNDTVYGDLYLKNNKIDAKGPAIYYSENEIPYKLPLYLVFNNVRAVKGQNATICHFEDEDGNLFAPWEIADLEVTLTNQYGNAIRLGLKYNMDLQGYSLNTSSLDYGKYKLNGVLSTNQLISNYQVKQAILSVTDESGKTTPVLKASDLTKVYGKNGELVITLKDCLGDPIANNFINVNINGNVVRIKTDSNGLARLAVNLNPNTYAATISYAGNDEYSSAAVTAKIIIKKANLVMTAKKKTFKQKAKTKKYTITLKNDLKNPIKKVKVTIKVNKKVYSAKTNSKGKATFNLKKLTKKGTYKAVITFAGNKLYNKVTKKVKIKVK